MRSNLALILAAPAVMAPRLALAEPPAVEGAAPPAAEAPADPAAARKKQAEERFYKGLGLYRDQLWDAALAEFLESRALHPTRAATRNAALSLRKLGRFDEALELFEALLAEFSEVPEEERKLHQRERDELRGLVGTLELRFEPGVTIVVDGRERGVTPLPPLRLNAGSHRVTAHREGFRPFSTTVAIAGGKTSSLEGRLKPLGVSGRPQVPERRGAAAEVVSDGVVVGPAPLEGAQPKIVLELAVGPTLSPSFNGEATTQSCGEGCSSNGAFGVSTMVHGGYQFGSGIGLFLGAGFFQAEQRVAGRRHVLKERPDALRQLPGSVDDAVLLRGLLIGAAGGYHLGDTFTFTARAGAGALIGTAADTRSGSFGALSHGAMTESHGARLFYVAPEARLGWRFVAAAELSLGLQGMFLLPLEKIRWQNERDVVTSELLGFYDEETLVGPTFFFTPGLAGRVDF